MTFLKLDITFYKNDTVTLNSIEIIEKETEPFYISGEYFIVLKNETNAIYNISYNVVFWLFTDPPTPLDKKREIIYVPFRSDIKYLEIYHNDKLLARYKIKFKVCIKDGICNKECEYDPDCFNYTCGNGLCEIPYENSINCPIDCPTGSKDGICDGIKDGKLDPDCRFIPWEDEDCKDIDYPCLNYFTKNYTESKKEYLKSLVGCSICDRDGICEEGENWYNCPWDCEPCSNNITCPNGYVKVYNCYGVNICVPLKKEEKIKVEIKKIGEIKIKKKEIRKPSKLPYILIVLLFIVGFIILLLKHRR